MGLLERLNVYKRVRNLEERENELLASLDTLRLKALSLEKSYSEAEQSLTHILEYMDRRSALLDALNRKILMFKTSESNDLDLFSDLDVM